MNFRLLLDIDVVEFMATLPRREQIALRRRLMKFSPFLRTSPTFRNLTPSREDQEDYFDVLFTLLEVYEAEHVKLKKVNPLKLLQNLCEEHHLSGTDLSRILGASTRHLGAMILRGEREITAAHARALGAHFHLPAGMFIE
jgi:antitoxin component HigA of HigAB toxin-antitoxin module